MATKKGKIVWIARDAPPDAPGFGGYNLFFTTKQPKQSAPGMYERQDNFFCKERFESVTGYKLSPGEFRRVRIKIEEVK